MIENVSRELGGCFLGGFFKKFDGNKKFIGRAYKKSLAKLKRERNILNLNSYDMIYI